MLKFSNKFTQSNKMLFSNDYFRIFSVCCTFNPSLFEIYDLPYLRYFKGLYVYDHWSLHKITRRKFCI